MASVYYVKSILEFKEKNYIESEKIIRKAINVDNERAEFNYMLYKIKERENKLLALQELTSAIQKIESVFHDDLSR